MGSGFGVVYNVLLLDWVERLVLCGLFWFFLWLLLFVNGGGCLIIFFKLLWFVFVCIGVVVSEGLMWYCVIGGVGGLLKMLIKVLWV